LQCIGNNAKTLGIKLPQFPDTDASGGLPDEAFLLHHRVDELLIQQNSIPVWERSQYP